VLLEQNTQEVSLNGRARVVRWQNVGRGAFFGRLLNGTLGFEIEILQEEAFVLIEVVKRGEQTSFFVIVVIALGP
jgi:hypothetical protein